MVSKDCLTLSSNITSKSVSALVPAREAPCAGLLRSHHHREIQRNRRPGRHQQAARHVLSVKTAAAVFCLFCLFCQARSILIYADERKPLNFICHGCQLLGRQDITTLGGMASRASCNRWTIATLLRHVVNI